VQQAPFVYQDVEGERRPVGGRYVIHAGGDVGFDVEAYDASRPMVIDPVLEYSTYLGGSDVDTGLGIAVDGAGSAYITGYTDSADFPTTSPYLTDQTGTDVFVTKLSPSGSSLVYSTYLGGDGNDYGYGVAVDASGNAWVTGQTSSTDFPTVNPYATHQGGQDAFVTKLSPSGSSLAYSTYLGGTSDDSAASVALDALGSAYVTGYTASTDFPVVNPFQTNQGATDAFVTKVSPSGSSLAYSTYLGGGAGEQAFGIAVDGSGSAYVTGSTYSSDFPTLSPYQTDQADVDVFVTKLSPSGSSLVYSTYLGGGGYDSPNGVALDGSGSAYVTGVTTSPDFPTLNPYQTVRGLYDAFLTKLSPSGSSLVYSTYLGGGADDVAYGVAVDASGSAHVTGVTTSTDFPTVSPYQTDQGSADAFVTKVSPSGASLVYSTYFGGGASDFGYSIAVDGSGGAYVTGETASTDLPTQDPYETDQPSRDAFAAKLTSPAPYAFYTLTPCRIADTRNPASPLGGPVLACSSTPLPRTFPLAGTCGIPTTARAISFNVTATQPTTAGHLRIFPAASLTPLASSINYSAGQTRANNGIALLGTGHLNVSCHQSSGTTHVIIDVNGYFE
jgi:hypothetical protein